MSDGIERRRRALINEIFQLTGQKMCPDDPATIAALFYSSLVREATDELKRAGWDIQRQLKATLEQEATSAVRKEIDSQQSRLSQHSEDLMRKIKKAAASVTDGPGIFQLNSEAPRWGLRAVIIVAVAITVSSLMAAYMFAEKLTLAERRDLQYGQQVNQAYPYLDKKTQKALDDAIATAAKSK